MASVLQSAWEALWLTLSWPNVLYPIAGTLLAMMVATVPGVSGVALLALAIPLTMTWEPLPTVLLFGALVGGATFMGSVTAILVNIPGTSANAATTFDGYPLTQRGEARTALGCSAAASALGSTFGIVVLCALMPLMRELLLFVGPLEMVMLILWGLTTIAAVSRGALIKGLAMAGLGLLTGFIGLDPRTAELRYTFGADYLQDGLDVMPVFLGMFAVTEMIELLASGKATISGKTSIGALSGSVREGVGAVFRHAGLTIRSSVLGSVVGLIPGVGGAVASFVAYGHAMRHAGRGQESFGRGDIRGVLAPEAANDAKDGAALIPTLFLGIPGSAGTAMLLVVLALHGLSPGPDLLDSQLTLVFVLVWSLFLSNWLTSILGLAVVTPLTRLSVIRTHLLLPPILSLIVVAAIIYGGRIEDVFVAFGVGVGGYYLKKYGWPRLPFVIALVLGPLFERHFMIYLQLRDLERISFWREPFAIGLAGLLVASLLWPGLRRLNMDARR